MRAVPILVRCHPLADKDLGNAAVLAEVVWSFERRNKFLARKFGAQTHHIYEVLLHHPHVGQVLAVRGLHFTLFTLLVLFRVGKTHDSATLASVRAGR